MSFQTRQALQLVIGNSHAEERIFDKNGIEIQVLSAMRPTRESDASRLLVYTHSIQETSRHLRFARHLGTIQAQ
jgi:hypothetical protein